MYTAQRRAQRREAPSRSGRGWWINSCYCVTEIPTEFVFPPLVEPPPPIIQCSDEVVLCCCPPHRHRVYRERFARQHPVSSCVSSVGPCCALTSSCCATVYRANVVQCQPLLITWDPQGSAGTSLIQCGLAFKRHDIYPSFLGPFFLVGRRLSPMHLYKN